MAAAGVRPDILAKAADEYGVASTYTDYREMLDKEDLDGVLFVLCSPDRDRLLGVVEVDETYVGGPEVGTQGRPHGEKGDRSGRRGS